MPEFELEPGEKVILTARKHWFIFAAGLLPYAILAVLPFTLPRVLSVFAASTPLAVTVSYSQPLFNAALGVWLLVVWTAAWGSFTRYYLNLWVLTNQRIVDITQRSYFSRKVSSLMLSRVQDVTTNVSGVLESLLGIGGITVQSAGAVDEFHMRGIPEPEHMRDLILRSVSAPATEEGV